VWEQIYSSRCNRYDTSQYTQEQLVSLVRDALNAQWKVVFTTFADDEKPKWQMSNGQVLNGKHCYVVIEEVQGSNAFKLYNPWGLDSGNEREIPFTDLRGSIDRIYIH
jgi:hypothetical protein